MTVRWYVWPVQEIDEAGTLWRGPRYIKWFKNPGGIEVAWSWIDYGLMPTALLVAEVTVAQHALANGQADIITIPENIDSMIGSAALAAVAAALESLHIPAGWVTTAHTYRDVMRKTAQLFLLSQRYHGRTAKRLIEAGITLNTSINQLPDNVRVSLNESAKSLGWDTSAIGPSWTLRQALGYLADQWGDTPILFGSFGEL